MKRRIFTLSMSCPRDAYSFALMIGSLRRIRLKNRFSVVATGFTDEPGDGVLPYDVQKYCAQHNVLVTDRGHGWGNGADWIGAMQKLRNLRVIEGIFNLTEHDYVVSIDSDVIFFGTEHDNVFNGLKEHGYPEMYGICQGRSLKNGQIINTKSQLCWTKRFGVWGHMSGGFACYRGDIVKQMTKLTHDQIMSIQHEMNDSIMPHNEDVVMAYMASVICGFEFLSPEDADAGKPRKFDMVPMNHRCKFNDELLTNPESAPLMSHYNFVDSTVLGQEHKAKWDLPAVICKHSYDLACKWHIEDLYPALKEVNDVQDYVKSLESKAC